MKPYYADDHVTLFHGDCREVTDWLQADILVTDPPYGIGWKRGAGTSPRSRPGIADAGHDGIANDSDTSTRDAALHAWGSTRPAIIFGSFYAAAPADFQQVLAWQKWSNSGVVGSTTGWRRDVEPVYILGPWPKRAASRTSVLTTTGGTGNARAPQTMYGHPHAKPLNVLQELIDACPPGMVADPFAGSGTTLVAAKALGRSAIGVELDERYCEVTARRLAQGVLDFGVTA
jgi:DNA modification methylase